MYFFCINPFAKIQKYLEYYFKIRKKKRFYAISRIKKVNIRYSHTDRRKTKWQKMPAKLFFCWYWRLKTYISLAEKRNNSIVEQLYFKFHRLHVRSHHRDIVHVVHSEMQKAQITELHIHVIFYFLIQSTPSFAFSFFLGFILVFISVLLLVFLSVFLWVFRR